MTEADPHSNNLPPETVRTVDAAVQVAVLVGAGVTSLLLAICGVWRPLWLVQHHGAATLAYVGIRALAIPAVAVLGVLQTANLGRKDVAGPVILTALALVVNGIGNALLVPRLALTGAALATAVAQYTAAGYAWVRWMRTKQKWSTILPSTQQSWTGRILPPKDVSRRLLQYFIPVTTTHVSRMSTSLTLDSIVVRAASPLVAAAHQIITSVYYGVVTPLADGLNLAGQTWTPSMPRKFRGRLQWTLARAGVAMGLLLAAVMSRLQFNTAAFTTDALVQNLVRSVVSPQLVLIGCLQAWFAVAEGLLLGQADLKFVGLLNGVFAVVVPVALLTVAGGTGLSPATMVTRIWSAWTGYVVVRMGIVLLRLVCLSRRTQNQLGDEGALQ
jgi:Na+-driven multidrug efflux pump